jgi:hypothetical protein
MRTLSVLVFVLSAAWVCAQPLTPDPTLGSRPGAFTARSLSLGHCFVTDQLGSAALHGNPATLATQEKRWRFDINGDLSRVEETRKYPVYDAFNGVIVYNNYALNDHLYSRLNGGVAYRVTSSSIPPLVLSVGSYSLYRFDYTYHEEVRDRYSAGGIQDRKLGDNKYDISGDMRSVAFGAGMQAARNLAVGFSASVLAGKWTATRGVYYENPDSTDQVTRVEYKPEGTPMELNVGAVYQVSSRVKLGGRALVPAGFEIQSTPESVAGLTSRYPSRYTAGIEYRPQSEFRPMLLLEGEVITYKQVSSDFDDTFEIRAGAEQQVVPGVPVRIGFLYASSPQDKDKSSTLFTAGIGFTLQKLSGDFGVEMGQVNYLTADMFPQSLYGGINRSDLDRVETDVFRGLVSLRYDL